MTNLDGLNFPFFAKSYQDNLAEREDQTTVVRDLLVWMFEPKRVPKEKEEHQIDKSTANRYFDGKSFLPAWIIRAANHPSTRKEAYEYVKSTLLPNIPSSRLANFVAGIKQCADNSTFVDVAHRKHFDDLIADGINEESASHYVAETLLYAINQSRNPGTKRQKNKLKTTPLEAVTPPASIMKNEQTYVDALIAVYDELDDTKYTPSSLAPLRQEHFTRQRQDFYRAECVRIRARDIYSDEDMDPFEVMVDELYEGVIDEWEKPHENGMACLTDTLAQAVRVQLGRTKLEKETCLIGASERKGTCHILVNEKRISGWVK